MTVPALLVTLIASLVLPFAVSLTTKSTASTWIKQAVTALLAAASGLLVTATQLDGTAVISKASALLALTTFIATEAAYVGVWKSHAINAAIVPTVGIG
jgi:hypothetical protein